MLGGANAQQQRVNGRDVVDFDRHVTAHHPTPPQFQSPNMNATIAPRGRFADHDTRLD